MTLARTEMFTQDRVRIWRVVPGIEATCDHCKRVLAVGELVTHLDLGLGRPVVVCKFCRPCFPFYTPEPLKGEQLDSVDVGRRYWIRLVRHDDGAPYLALRNSWGGRGEMWIDPQEAGDLAVALVEAAMHLIEMTNDQDGDDLQAMVCHICGHERRGSPGGDCPICLLDGERGTLTVLREAVIRHW